MKINGVVEDKKDVTLEPGASQTVSFAVTKKAPGTYQADLNGLTSSFVVQGKAVSRVGRQWLIGATAVVVVLAGLATYLLVARQRKGRARRPTEPSAAARVKQQAEEARERARQQAERVSLTEGAEPATTGELYRGTVTLTIIPPVDFSQLWEFQNSLRQAENISVVRTGGSVEEGTIVVVSLEKPLPLIDILRGMPSIEQLLKKNDRILVILKSRSAT
jgi:hypothetical protein